MKKTIPLTIVLSSIALILVGFFLLRSTATDINVNQSIPGDSDTKLTIRVPATQKISPTTNSPKSPDGPDSHWFYSEPVVLEKDVTVTGFNISMEGADASILHHVSIGVLGRTAKICPAHYSDDKGTYEIYTASRITLDPIVFPKPYGISLSKGEALTVEFMAHPQAHPHGAHTSNDALEPTLVVELATSNDRIVPIDFIRLRLDDTPCTTPLMHQAFTVPTNASYTKTSENNEQSSSYYFASSTTIILGGANFWPRKGGQDVSVLLNDELVQQFMAEPTDNDTGWNIPLSLEPINVPAESTIKIQSTYTNPFDEPIQDASGMYGFFYIQQ
jgi:hypothetical protein